MVGGAGPLWSTSMVDCSSSKFRFVAVMVLVDVVVVVVVVVTGENLGRELGLDVGRLVLVWR